MDTTKKIKERFIAFWNKEIVDRVCIAVAAPQIQKDCIPWPVSDSDDVKIFGPDYNVCQAEAIIQNIYRAGDYLPVVCAAGNLFYPAFGGKGKTHSGTVWVDPTHNTWQDWKSYEFDYNNLWLERYFAVHQALVEGSKGRWIVGTQGFFGAMDAMALIRGYNEFILELACFPEAEEAIRSAHKKAIEGHKYYVKKTWEMTLHMQHGTAFGNGLWAPGTITQWSADFTALISPKDFAKWMIPEMKEMIDACDYSIYHLDGPDAAIHLPIIADMEDLNCIQYTRGAAGTLEFGIKMTKEIQKYGKVTYLDCNYDEVEQVLNELDPHGLFLTVWAPDPETAERVVDKAYSMTASSGAFK